MKLKAAISVGVLAIASEARADETGPPLAWTLLQLVPSPAVALEPDATHFAMRWQVTGALYSFAAADGVRALRSLYVPPILRHGGSVELYWSPGLWFRSQVDVRHDAGLRVYVPLLTRGESLSASAGTALVFDQGVAVPSYEVGAYSLFGYLGLVASAVPAERARSLTLTLAVRVF